MSRYRRALSGLVLISMAVSAPAAAQDAGQLIKAGDEHLAKYQYGPALQQYIQIPDTATPEQRLEKHLGIAMSLMGVSRFNDVNEHVTMAQEIAGRIGTDTAMARAKDIEGQFLYGTKTADRGLAAYTHAAQLAERAGNQHVLAAVYGHLSNTFLEFEDFERYLYYQQKAYDLIDQPTVFQQFNNRVTLGVAEFEMYNRNAAEAAFKAALDLSAVTKRPRDRSFSLGELAFLYHTFDKDYARALTLYDEAIEYSRIAKVVAMEANWLVNRANVYRDRGEYARAERDYREAIAMLDANAASNVTFHMWKNVGQVMRLTGRTKDAAALLDKLIRERTQDASPRHLWQAHMELATALETLGDRDGARRHFESMIGVLEEHRKTSILDSFRTGSFAHALSSYDPYDRYIRFMLAERRGVEALGITERARARAFLEALGSVRGAVAVKLPPSLLAEESRISRAISTAQQKLRLPSQDKAQREASLAELTTAEMAREKFLLALRVEHATLAEARYPTFLDIAEIQKALRPGETVISFYLMEPASQRWIITPASVTTTTIAGRSQIEAQSQKLIGALSAPGDAAYREWAEQLSAMLLGPAGPESARTNHPITIVPHGILNYVPFEVLPYGGPLMVEHHAVSYAPSLNALVQLRRAAVNSAPFRVLAVGNPAVESGQVAERGADVENLALLGTLPYAGQELQAIGRTFPDRTRILSGASARETDLRSPLTARFPVIHFATHGLVSDEHPKRSGLLLAPEHGEDGLLQTSEIYGLGLNANLIMLSACRTALGKEITGEGLVGLSRAFFYAGARSVVATLWNLNDRFAAGFVERFYRELNTGVAADEALRRAKAAFVGDATYSHPFYWSSLVMLGDGTRPLVPEPVRPSLSLRIIAAGFGVLASLILVSKLRILV